MTTSPNIPPGPSSSPVLSVLDQGQIPFGGSAKDAVADTLVLGQLADRLGFERLWVTEHHGAYGVASSAPAVLIALIAAGTKRIRVGSGALLLPNYSSLTVVEQFGTLVCAFGDRIDLGIGRSSGADTETSILLRGNPDEIPEDEFARKLEELEALFAGTFRVNGHRIFAIPGEGNIPELWLLGSSEYSARQAGQRGMRFCYAHHFSGASVEQSFAAYRNSFVRSDSAERPYCALSVGVISDDHKREADLQLKPLLVNFVRRRQGLPTPAISVEQAAGYKFSDREKQMVAQRTNGQAIGTPSNVERIIRQLAARTEADEVMLVPWSADRHSRARTLEIISERFDLSAL